MNNERKQKILELRAKGLSYNTIMKEIKCTKSLLSYYLGDKQKEKNYKRWLKNKVNRHPYQTKIDTFTSCDSRIRTPTAIKKDYLSLLYRKIVRFHVIHKMGVCEKMSFSVSDVINKISETPKCYLTGDKIDITKTRSYHFDHMIPRSKGGTNDLNNLGVCTKQANEAKGTMTPEELILFCKKVLTHNGYFIEKK